MASTPKFRVTHNRKADKAKRYRYAIVAGNGQTMQSGEGYPTHQHVTRAIEGLWKGFAKLFGVGVAKDSEKEQGDSGMPPVPYAADSLQPGAIAEAKAGPARPRAPAAKKAPRTPDEDTVLG